VWCQTSTTPGNEYDDITRQSDTTYPTLAADLERDRHRGHDECATTKKYHTSKKTDSIFVWEIAKYYLVIERDEYYLAPYPTGQRCMLMNTLRSSCWMND
jgi:hypothetical protein